MSLDTLDSNLDLTETLENKLFLGEVIENVDPKGMDRIKVKVIGLYDPDKGEVPWCGKLKDSPFGQSETHGVYGSPQIGDDVVILLQHGNPQFPLYYSIQRYSSAEMFPSGKSWGYTDPNNNQLKIDLEGNTVEFKTGTGVVFNVDADGNVTVTAPADVSMSVAGSLLVETEGDMTLNTQGNVQMTTQGTTNIESEGSVLVRSSSDVRVEAPSVVIEGITQIHGNTSITGDLSITGNINSSGTLRNNGVNIGSTHKHGGVQTGSGTSGVPIP